MKKVLFLISVLYCVAFSQPVFHPPLLSDINIIPADSSNIVFYSYRIPSNFFVYFKDGKIYSADYRMAVEVRDSSSSYFTRQIGEKKINAATFEETTYGKTYEQGLFRFRLKSGKYIFTPIITDLNSNHEYRLHPLRVSCEDGGSNNFLKPIVIDHKNKNSENNFSLTNYGGEIPFSEDRFDLIIPSRDTTVNEIKVILISNMDTLSSIKASDNFISGISLRMNGGDISVTGENQTKYFKNFLLKNFSLKLKEGRLKIILSASGIHKQEFVKKIVWFNEPFSLKDPERAIKFLNIVENTSLVDSLLSGSSKNYMKHLLRYWKKFDPTPQSAFNPLMEEYYKRVDYALRHFFPIVRRREEITDRGKIYIKYGKPEEVKRSYNQYGKSIETWIYNNHSEVFNFIDPDGTGNFILVKE